MQTNKKLQILLDVTAAEADKINEESDRDHFRVATPSATVPNRRVYYLAINHRIPALSDENVRAAFSRAISREKPSTISYRGSLKRQVHKTINSLYPARCWACDPMLISRSDRNSCDPFDADLARAKLRAGEKKLPQGGLDLELKYPDGDPVLRDAMTALAAQVQEVLQVRIRLLAVDARQLQDDLAIGKFDLAYCHYDFPDDTFWLGPLFAPRKGDHNGENIFGFQNDRLLDMLQKSISYREFHKVRECTRAIHDILMEETPVIPLWQLDPLHAMAREVKAPPFDPLRVFTDVEKWRLE